MNDLEIETPLFCIWICSVKLVYLLNSTNGIDVLIHCRVCASGVTGTGVFKSNGFPEVIRA